MNPAGRALPLQMNYSLGRAPNGDSNADENAVDARTRLEYLFGPPQEPFSLRRGVSTTSIQLPEVYKGYNFHIKNVIMSSMQATDMRLFSVLPLEIQAEPSPQIHWDEVLFSEDRMQLGLTPEESNSRLLSMTRTEHSATTVRKGIALQIESDLLGTPRGEEIFDAELLAITQATLLSLYQDIMVGLLDAAKNNVIWDVRHGSKMMSSGLTRGVMEEVELFASLQKRNYGMISLDNVMKRRFNTVAQVEPDCWIMPNGALSLIANGSSFDYMFAGEEGAKAKLSGFQTGRIVLPNNAEVIEARLIHTHGAVADDLLSRTRTVGEYHLMMPSDVYPDKPLPSGHRDIFIYNESSDRFSRLSFESVIDAASPEEPTAPPSTPTQLTTEHHWFFSCNVMGDIDKSLLTSTTVDRMVDSVIASLTAKCGAETIVKERGQLSTNAQNELSPFSSDSDSSVMRALKSIFSKTGTPIEIELPPGEDLTEFGKAIEGANILEKGTFDALLERVSAIYNDPVVKAITTGAISLQAMKRTILLEVLKEANVEGNFKKGMGFTESQPGVNNLLIALAARPTMEPDTTNKIMEAVTKLQVKDLLEEIAAKKPDGTNEPMKELYVLATLLVGTTSLTVKSTALAADALSKDEPRPRSLDELVRACIMFTPCTAQALKHLVRHNVMVPVGAIVFSPFQTHTTKSALLVKKGCGKCFVSSPSFLVGEDAARKYVHGHYTQRQKAVVMASRQVLEVPNVCMSGYVGGNNTVLFRHRKDLDGYTPTYDAPSLLAHLVPIATEENGQVLSGDEMFKSAVDILGRYSDNTYTGAAWFQRYWGGLRDLVKQTADDDKPLSGYCFRGSSYVFNPSTKQHTSYVIGVGHKGDAYAGCASVRNGVAGFFRDSNAAAAAGVGGVAGTVLAR